MSERSESGLMGSCVIQILPPVFLLVKMSAMLYSMVTASLSWLSSRCTSFPALWASTAHIFRAVWGRYVGGYFLAF